MLLSLISTFTNVIVLVYLLSVIAIASYYLFIRPRRERKMDFFSRPSAEVRLSAVERAELDASLAAFVRLKTANAEIEIDPAVAALHALRREEPAKQGGQSDRTAPEPALPPDAAPYLPTQRAPQSTSRKP